MNKTVKYIQIVYWLASIIFLMFFLVFSIPHKGVNLADTGIYFTSSNDYLHGVFNEYGLAGLINALLLTLHFGYLNLSRFFYLLQYIAGLFFFFSLRLRSGYYWLVPVAVTLMLASAPVHALAYETAGPIMLLLGLAFLFLCLNYQLPSPLKNVSYVLSAIFFCYSAVVNLILVPFLFVNAFILFFIFPKVRNLSFMITYIIASVIGLYLIIFKTLPLFELTTYYNPHLLKIILIELTKNSLMITGFILLGFITTQVLLRLCHFVVKLLPYFNDSKKSVSTDIAFVAATILLWIGTKYGYNGFFFTWQNNLLFYGFVFLGVIFAIYGINFHKSKILRLLAFSLILSTFYYLAMIAAVPLPWYMRSAAHASEICLIVLLWLEYLFGKENSIDWKKYVITIVILFSAIHYSLKAQMNYAFGHFVALQTKKITTIPRLNGAYVYPGFLDSVKKIITVYKENDCENKLFIERARFPLFYFIFNRVGHPPFFYLNSKNDLQELQKAKKTNGYCYFGDIAFDGYALSKKPMLEFHKLHQWLQTHSRKIITVPINDDCCVNNSYIKIYVY